MSGEANILTSSIGSVKLITEKVHLGYPPNTFVAYGSSTLSATVRPPTTHNKRNANGVRPMSAFHHGWCKMAEIPTPITTMTSGMYNIAIMPGSFYAGCLGQVPEPSTPNQAISLIKPTPWAFVSADSKARNAVLKKASQVKWDLLASAGELRETCEMIMGMAKQTANTYIRYRNRNGLEGYRGDLLKSYDRWISGAKSRGDTWIEAGLRDVSRQGLTSVTGKSLDAFRNQWMQYQMGVKPLMYDISQACDYFNGLEPDALPAVLLKAGAETESNQMYSPVDIFDIVTLKRIVRGRVMVNYRIICRKTPSGMSTASALGLNRGLSTAWELTRLSWLIDGMVDIGGWLKAWYARDDVSFVEGCKSTLWNARLEPLGKPQILGPNTWVGKPWDPKWLLECGYFERELLTALPVPGIMPDIKALTGVRQCLNTIFGLAGLFGKKI